MPEPRHQGRPRQQPDAGQACCGSRLLYHYDPRRIGQGENPFVLDSKEPSNGFREFLLSEVRYSSLKRQFPERAEMLYEKAEADAKARRSNYTRLANK